jgi:hypothetical protein
MPPDQCPAARATSSTIVSMTNAVCVLPTDRHHSTGTAVSGWEIAKAHR